MRLRESKNLKYDKRPHIEDNHDSFDPKFCILKECIRTDNKLTLYYKNGSVADIKARNTEGEKELSLIEAQMEDSIGKSYEEILDIEF